MDNREKRKVITEFLKFCRKRKVYLMHMNDKYGLDINFTDELKLEDEFIGEDRSNL